MPRLNLRPRCSYRFRQRSNFWYLTGFEEPDSALILGAHSCLPTSPCDVPADSAFLHAEKDSSAKGYKMTLFCHPKEPYDELWNGARTGLDGAREIFGADEVRTP